MFLQTSISGRVAEFMHPAGAGGTIIGATELLGARPSAKNSRLQGKLR